MFNERLSGVLRVRSPNNDYATVRQDGKPLNFMRLATRAGNIRQRVDKNEYEPGFVVFDDLEIGLQSRIPLFAGFNVSQSLFSAHTREGSIMEISRDNELIFAGIIKDAVSEYDTATAVERIKLLSPLSVLRRVGVPGGQLTNGILWTDAVRSCFSNPLLVGIITFDGDFGNLDFAENIDRDTLRVDDVSSLTGKSAYEVLTQLLTICMGVARLSVAGVCSIYSRNRATAQRPITITDDLVLKTGKARSGASRSITTATVTIGGDTDNDMVEFRSGGSSDLYGSQTPQNFNLEWITARETAEQYARWITRYTAYPRQEITLTVPADAIYSVNSQFGIFDRVIIDTGDGARYPAAIGGAYASEVYNTALNGEYRCFAITYDLRLDTINLQLRA